MTTTSLDYLITQKTYNHTILIVEDDESIGAFLLEVLKPYRTFLATDAFEAQELLKTVRPDLFIFDYLLPHINGLELYDALHARKEYRTIPVLLISASITQEHIRARGLPFLQKPFELEEFLHMVEILLAA